MPVPDSTDGCGDVGSTPQVVSPRTAIMLRAIGYGFLAGLVSGALVGGGMVLAQPPWLAEAAIAFAVSGGIVGSMVGLVIGLMGGAAFAMAWPHLARQAPSAARLAGAAVMPGALVIIGCVSVLWRTAKGQPVEINGPWVLWTFLVLSAVGSVPGALVGPRVLHGKRRTAPDAGDRTPCSPTP